MQNPASVPRSGSSIARLGLACCAAIVVVWVVVFAWVVHLRSAEEAAARRELTAFATLLSDHTDRTLQGVDLLLTSLVGKLEAAIASDPAGSAAQHAILRTGLEGMPQIRSALVLAPDGTSVGDANAVVPRPFNGSDRAYFQVHRDAGDRGLFIGDPVQSRINGLWAISLSRRLKSRNGAFAGVIVAAVDPSYFAALYSSTGASADLDVTLLKRTGIVLATTAGDPATRLGKTIEREGLDVAALAHAVQGVVRIDAALGAGERIAAFAGASAYPLMVLVTRNADLISRQTVGGERMIAAAGAAVTVLIVLLGGTIVRQMRSLESRFRDGIERMPDGFMLWDAEERLVAWNSRADRLMPEMVPFRVPGVRFVDYIRDGGLVVFGDKAQSEREEIAAFRIARFREAGAPWQFRTDDDRTIEVDETRTASGGTVSIYRDVTAWRRQREDLETALVAEREANLAHRRFIAMASHEFRTPLAIIDGTAQRVAGMVEKTSSRVDERMARIRESVARMIRLMDRMLSSARLDEGRIVANLERLDLSALLSDTIGRQRQISADFVIDLRLPAEPIIIDADPQLLEQVFSNLISNAVKYSDRSRAIEICAAWRIDESPRVAVTVTDHGVGIPADEIEHLFTRFFRARTATGIPGTGIGLYLVRELVQLHGGRVHVASRLGTGSTFTVEFPAANAATRPAPGAA